MTTPIGRLVIALVLVSSVTACRPAAPPAADEMPTRDVTHWTSRTELFMEYPPLVAGRSALFAVHLTQMQDFQPVTAGQVTITFTPERGGPPATLTGPKPSRPGAFRVDGAPPTAGQYQWALPPGARGWSDRHDLGVITVFADETTARADTATRPADDPSAIAYLKEQQWTNSFGTAPV